VFDPYDPRQKQPVQSDPWAPIQTVSQAPAMQGPSLSEIVAGGASGEQMANKLMAEEEAKKQQQQQQGQSLLKAWLTGGWGGGAKTGLAAGAGAGVAPDVFGAYGY
jgi:hypothetical protein